MMKSNQFIQISVILLWTLVFIQNLPMIHGDHLTVNETNRIDDPIHQACQRSLSYEQIKNILKKHPCISLEDIYGNNSNGSHRRYKHWLGGSSGNSGGDSQIAALSSIINDHRTMINYIMNTSVNATFVKDSITDHHENNGPNFRSWRDIFDLLCMTIIIAVLLYVIIFRCGFRPCNLCLLRLSRLFIPRTQQKQQTQQQLEEQIKKQLKEMQLKSNLAQDPEHKKKRSIHRKAIVIPSTPSATSDIVQYNSGYVSE